MLTHNYVRKQFLIVNGRNAVHSVTYKCLVCYKFKPRLAEHKMENLPEVRVRPASALTPAGVDSERTALKRYIVVFICLVPKWVHLEPFGDLTSQTFIGALSRFVQRV